MTDSTEPTAVAPPKEVSFWEDVIDIFFQSIVNALARGEKIELRGFGSFRIRKRNARQGRNPKTGENVSVPAKRIPYFKPGRELKELLNV